MNIYPMTAGQRPPVQVMSNVHATLDAWMACANSSRSIAITTITIYI